MRSSRQHLVDICRRLYDRFYLVATDGNVSLRLDSGRILTTPTGTNKGFLEPDDLVVVDPEGRLPPQGGKPSTELAMHIEVYRQRPEVGAVVHAHPRAATAFAAAGLALDTPLMTESICGLGTVPLSPLALPSTQEVPAAIRPYVARTNAILLQSHGVLTYGRDLMEAYNRMEAVEQFAQVQLMVLQLCGGGVDPARTEQLLQLRAKYGMTDPVIPPNPMSPLLKPRC